MRPSPQKSRSPFATPRGLCFFDLRQGEGRVASLPWVTRIEAAIVAASCFEKETTMTKTVNLPSHRVYAVTKEGKQKFWRAIGAAWPHSDGEGFFVKLDYLPLTPGAQIVIRKPKAEEAEPAAEVETA
jgi:hypothetical protein